MADEVTEAPVSEQDQPNVPDAPAQEAAPEPTPGFFDEKFDPASLSDELRPAYNQLRGDYTQKTQALAEQRKEVEQEQQLLSALRSDDPDTQREALEFLGYEIPQEAAQEEDDYVDPFDELRAEVTALREARDADQQAQQTYQQEQQEINDLEKQFSALEQQTGREFSDDEVDMIAALSFSKRDDTGSPDVRGAYERLYSDFLTKQRSQWVGSKKAPKAPQGQSGTETFDFSNSDARVQRMADMMEAGD